MNRFDSALSAREQQVGLGTRLRSFVATLLSLLVVGSVAVGAQTLTHIGPTPPAGPFVAGEICAGNAPQLRVSTNALPTVVYNAAGIAWPGLEAEVAANDIPIGVGAGFIGDDQVFQIPAADILAAAGGAFNFDFYGETHNLSAQGLFVGTNGFLRFQDGNLTNDAVVEFFQTGIAAQAIPAVGGPNGAIYFLNLDLAPQIGEDIDWEIQDVNGDDALVITFRGVSQYNPVLAYPYNQVDVQVIIYPNNHGANPNYIEVRLANWPDPAVIPDRNHTIGVENKCGNVATAANANHNNDPWANANGAGEVANYAVQFNPVAGANQTFNARLVITGANGNPNTYSLAAAAGDDAFRSASTGGTTATDLDITANTALTTVTPAGDREYYAVIEYQNCGIAITNEVLITVNPTPAVQLITGPASVCVGANSNYSVTATAGNTYLWTSTDGAATITPTANTAVVQWGTGSNGGTNQTLTCTENTPAGCQAIHTKIVTVYTTPTGTVAGPGAACAEAVTAGYSVPAGYGSYTWAVTGAPAGTTISAGQGTPNATITWGALNQPNAAMNASVTCTMVNGVGSANCTFTTPGFAVTVNPRPAPGKTVNTTDATPCVNQAITYSISGTFAGNSYSYTAAGGTFNYTAPGGYVNGNPVLNLASVTLQWTNAGAGRSMTINEITAAGCSRSVNLTGITVEALPTPVVTGPSLNVCGYVAPAAGNPSFSTVPSPREYTYAAAVANVNNNYAWTITGGTIVAVNSGTITTALTASGVNCTQITVRWNNPTEAADPVNQTINLTETSVPNGCVGSAPVFNVSTMHSAISTDFSLTGAGIGGAANPCANATGVVYTANEVLADAVTHQFYVLAGGSLASTTPTTATVNWGNAATGIIRHEITNTASGCTSYEDYTITITPLPEGDITGQATVCGGNAGLSYSIINVVNGPITAYAWSLPVNPGAIATLTTPVANPTASLNFGNPGATTVVTLQCVITGPAPSNCTNTLTFNITVNPTPAAPVITGDDGGGTPEYVCAGTVEAYTVTGVAGGTTTISVTGGIPTQTTFAGAGPHNFNVTWGFVPGGGAGNISATITALNCPSAPTNLGVTVTALPALPIFEYSLDNVTYSTVIPPLCVTNVPYYIRVQNTTAGVTYNWLQTAFTFGGHLFATLLISDNPGGGVNELVTVTSWNSRQTGWWMGAYAQDNVTGCISPGTGVQPGAGNTFPPYTFTNQHVVNPVPAPVISGPVDACNNTTNPSGVNGSVLDANPATFKYTYQTAYVAVNSYAWTVTNGYIIGYRVNSTGPWTYINPVQTTTGAPVLGANQILVTFYGNTPGKVKVSEIAPGGCQFTTLDYNVNLNAFPIVQTLTPASQDICQLSGATVSIASSQVGFTYRVEKSTDGGSTWTPATTAGTIAGTGAALNFNIAASDLLYTAVPAAVTTYDIRVTSQNTVGALTCGWYPASNTTQIFVNPKPAATPSVANLTPLICTGEPMTIQVGNTQNWVLYQLEESPIGLNTWSATGLAVSGNGGTIQLNATAPAGGVPTINADNYDYRVLAYTNMSFGPPTPNIACSTYVTQQTTARVFALPTNPNMTLSPNPVCWEENVTVNLANTQNGVQYEVNIGGSSLSPVVIINGNGGAANAVINSTEFQATNPVGSIVIPNVQVTARIAIYGAFTRPIPPSACATNYGATNLTVLEKPVAVITGPDTVCGPSTTSYTASPVTPSPISTFDWLITNTPQSAPAGTTPLVANNTGDGTVNPYVVNWGVNLLSCNGTYNPLTTTIRMIATNNNGCADTAFKTVVINPTLNDIAITGDPTACIYGGFEQHLETYTVSRPGGCVFPAGTTFLWTMPAVGNPVSGAIRSGQGTTTIIGEWITTSGTGIGTVTVTATLPASHGGCATTRSINVNVYPLPQPVINGPANVCQNQQSVVYTADNYPTDTYLWEVLGGTIVGGTGAGVPGNLGTRTGVGLNTITINWLNAANPNAYIRLTQTSVAGCMNKTTYNVTVHPTPVPVINGPGIVCDNSVVTYNTANNAPVNVYNWTISGNATIQSGANQSSVNVLTGNIGGGTSFTLTLNERVLATGCETTVQRTINMVAKPQPTITRISPLPGAVGGACLNEEVEYGNTDLVAANPSWSYQWTVSNGVINPTTPATGATIKVAWNTVGTGTLTLAKWHTGSQCTTVVSQTINITNKPAPAIAGPTVVCGGEENTYTTPAVAGNTYLWSVTGGTLVSGNTANSAIVKFPNPANLTSTSATVSVVETNVLSGCQGNASVVVTINYMPQATTINGLTTVCNNSTTTYSIAAEPAGLSYTWTVTGGAITAGAGTSSINVEWSSVGNQTVGVTLKNGTTDCEKTITKVVTVEYQPAPSIAGDASVCTNESMTYSTPANAGSTYAWSVTGGTITSGLPANAPSVSVLWTVAGNQTITVTETNASGNCVGVKSMTVVVVATPVATNITRIGGGSVDKACETEVITYGTNIPSAAGMTFYWTVTGGSFQGGNTNPTATVQWNIQGEQVLTVKITTAGSDCSVTVTQNVAVTYKPTPNIDGATVACINKDHVYQTPYVPGSTYAWSITPTNVFAPITGYPNSNVIEVKWIQPGLHTITLTETNIAGGCFTTVSMNVQVNLIPTPFTTSTTGFGNPTGLRPGIVCNFSTHTYTTTATPGNTFIWTVTGGNITGGQYTNTISVAWGPAGTGTIAVQETIPGSDCITTKLDTILIRPTPTPVITGTNLNPCAGSVQTYSTPFVQGNSYYWDVPVGGTILSGQNSNQITVQWSSSVTWPNTQATSLKVTEWVTQVAPNAGLSAPYGAVTSCYGQTTTNITIRPNPSVPTISGPGVVCATDLNDDPQTNNTTTWSSSIPVQGSAQGFISYLWSTTSNGTIVGGNTGSSVSIRWANAGTTPTTGVIYLTHTSSWGCTSSNQFTVTINPIPNPDIAGPISVCQNSLHTYVTAGFPGHVYNWTVDGGNIIRAGQGTPAVTVEWTLPGSYTLQVSETNTYGCTVYNNTYVTVNELPVAEVTASGPTTFCQGGDVTLSAPIGFASYVWSTGETARSIVVRTTGQYWVKVTDGNGCSNSSDTITVNVFPNSLPIITVSGPTTFCEGGSVTLTAPNGFSAYLWSTGATSQSITVTESGTYTVTVADGNGCTGTSTEVDVFVNPAPAPVLTVVGSTTVCSGDSVEVRAPAGYVSYTWVATSGTNYGSTRSIWILQTDTVYAQVVDANGCVGQSDVVAITVAPVVMPTVAANGPTTFCDGNSVKLSAPEGFATYYWSNGATTREIVVENGGDYSVTVTNSASCPSVSSPTAVVVNPLPARPSITRTGDTLKAVSMQAETFQWFRNGVMIPGAEERNLVVAQPGTYRVEIGDNNTCTSKSDGFDVILTDVNEDVVAGHGAELRVFPNPTTGQFTIETAMAEAGNVKIELVNTVGENVLTLNEISNGGSFSMNVDMGTLASGVYNIVVTTANERWTVRLVRQ